MQIWNTHINIKHPPNLSNIVVKFSNVFRILGGEQIIIIMDPIPYYKKYRIWTGSPKHVVTERRHTCLPAVDDALLVGDGLGGGGLQPGAPSRLPNPRAPKAAAPRGRRIPIQVVGERVAQPGRNILLAQRDAQRFLGCRVGNKKPTQKHPPKNTKKTY
jgi:hypothetical protein